MKVFVLVACILGVVIALPSEQENESPSVVSPKEQPADEQEEKPSDEQMLTAEVNGDQEETKLPVKDAVEEEEEEEEPADEQDGEFSDEEEEELAKDDDHDDDDDDDHDDDDDDDDDDHDDDDDEPNFVSESGVEEAVADPLADPRSTATWTEVEGCQWRGNIRNYGPYSSCKNKERSNYRAVQYSRCAKGACDPGYAERLKNACKDNYPTVSCLGYKRNGYCSADLTDCKLTCGWCKGKGITGEKAMAQQMKAKQAAKAKGTKAKKAPAKKAPAKKAPAKKKASAKKKAPARRKAKWVTKKVNGRWSPWGGYRKCSKQCGPGTKKRYRNCNNPTPKNGGRRCSGRSVITASCQLKTCRRNIRLINARSSSTYQNDVGKWGPKFGWTGNSRKNVGFFHSKKQVNPWIRFQLNNPLISSVTIVNRWTCCGERLRNIQIRAGKNPGLNNPVVGTFKGPGKTRGVHTIRFKKAVRAKYLFILRKDKGYLQINGIRLN